NAFSDSTLAFLTTTLEEEYKNLGITVEDTEIYQHEQAKFIKLYISQPNGSMIAYGLQYYTIYNNKAINITMHSYVGPLTAEDEALLSDIVDSTYFDTASAVTEPTTSPSAPDSNKDRAVSDRFRFENILFALLITIALYALPIVIYRYAVRKSPVPSGAAKIITGLYGVFSFLLTLIILNKSQWVISGGAIVLWSYVNYRLLRAGKKTDDNCGTDCINDSAAQERTEGEDTYEQTNSQTEGKMLFCRNCGTPLSVESEYCHKCGTKSH
ncbi:MAG: hypothetical protein LBM28_04345, partial [Oscillospiraceae bacterium]|nr:hypothetical protein [Oscillospiraceae bacterium]